MLVTNIWFIRGDRYIISNNNQSGGLMKSIRLLAFVTAAVLCMGAGPTTQPAGTNSLPAQAVGQKNLPSKVAIMPIAMLGDFQGHFWIGTAIQQSLSGDISQTGGMSAMSIVQGV